jgi:hypothetical protein
MTSSLFVTLFGIFGATEVEPDVKFDIGVKKEVETGVGINEDDEEDKEEELREDKLDNGFDGSPALSAPLAFLGILLAVSSWLFLSLSRGFFRFNIGVEIEEDKVVVVEAEEINVDEDKVKRFLHTHLSSDLFKSWFCTVRTSIWSIRSHPNETHGWFLS